MELDVGETCEYLQNRLNMPLMFEGRVVNIEPGRSACRQLWIRSQSSRPYADFLESLRFTIRGGRVWVSIAEDYAPWIGGGLASAAALGTGAFITNRYLRKPKTQQKNESAPRTDPQSTDVNLELKEDLQPATVDIAAEHVEKFPWQTQVPFDFITYKKWLDGLAADIKSIPDLVDEAQYAQALRKGLQDNFGNDMTILEYDKYKAQYPDHGIYEFKQYLTYLANQELSKKYSTPIPDDLLKPVDDDTQRKQQEDTFASVGVSTGKNQMLCMSVPNRYQGLCIYVDDTDKWDDFKRKINDASGIPEDDQIILVLARRINTLEGLKGWQSENHGFTRVVDARVIRKRNQS